MFKKTTAANNFGNCIKTWFYDKYETYFFLSKGCTSYVDLVFLARLIQPSHIHQRQVVSLSLLGAAPNQSV